MTHISKIEGIGGNFAKKLAEVGISTTERLLSACTQPQGRKELAAATGISHNHILKWANRADLSRIKGIGEEYADLLEAAGVDTVPELAQRNATNLQQKMVEINQEISLVRRVPALSQVTSWVSQAKKLPRMLHY